jgi:receptor protein-tyrosine kinase
MTPLGHIDRRLEAVHRPLPPSRPAATLDLAALADSGHLVPDAMDGRLAEEMRVIKQPLLRRARAADAASQRLRLVMVTSALPGEGKTTFAINLAMSLATEPDHTVLLVDVDVRRGHAMRRLGVDARGGLAELLANPAQPLHDLVRRTELPRLSVLPAGRADHLPTELLAGRACERLLDRLLDEHPDQLVVFDAPPLLTGSQAEVLAPQVGQVVVVVQAWRTPMRAVARAFARVSACAEVSAVLGRARATPAGLVA